MKECEWDSRVDTTENCFLYLIALLTPTVSRFSVFSIDIIYCVTKTSRQALSISYISLCVGPALSHVNTNTWAGSNVQSVI